MSPNRMVLFVLLVGLLAVWSDLLGVYGDVPEKCTQPKSPGRCQASFPRYYYDMTDKMCKEFIWGGCDANDNNFLTLEDCLRECQG